MEFPPPLVHGDTIRVVAPSGPFDDDLLSQGLARLSNYDVRVPTGMRVRQAGFFAGDDEIRLKELQEAFDCPHARAVLVARGGYGLARIAHRLDLEGFRRNPKWLVGFSDATVLHLLVGEAGFCSLHGPNGTTLAQAPPEDILALSDTSAAAYSELDVWTEGRASGPLFGGNLTVLFAEAAAGRLRIPRGAILLLEDVTETSYRIDRMLNALTLGGHFRELSGLVLGEFVDCSPGKFNVPTESVLANNLCDLGIPVLAGLPIGHGARNQPIVLGASYTMDHTSRRLARATLD